MMTATAPLAGMLGMVLAISWLALTPDRISPTSDLQNRCHNAEILSFNEQAAVYNLRLVAQWGRTMQLSWVVR